MEVYTKKGGTAASSFGVNVLLFLQGGYLKLHGL